VGCVPGRMGIDSIVPVDSLLAPDIYIYIYIYILYVYIYVYIGSILTTYNKMRIAFLRGPGPGIETHLNK
jgi:hypothetical protein